MEDFNENKLHRALHELASDLYHESMDPESPVRTLEAIIDVNADLVFAQGYRKLGILDFPLYEKCFFIVIADSFIQRGIEPFKFSQIVIARNSATDSDDEDEDEDECDNSQNSTGFPRVISETDSNPSEFCYLSYSREGLLLMGLKGLVKRGIVIMVPSVTDDNRPNGRDKDRYLLSSRACSVLFKGQDHLIGYDSLCRMAELHKSTSIRAKQLLFDEGFLPRIEEIKAILAPEKYDYLMDKFGGKGLNKSLNILFHGAPGTGKTELAMQLARECGRDIFVPDLARLEDSYIGESEKNYRELFRCFRYLAAISLYPPILLLNEADGIISRRVEVHRSSDKYMNSIQNILLEEMERFE